MTGDDEAAASFAAALLDTIAARDRYTSDHSGAVACYARDIAAHMGLPVKQQHLATCADWFTTSE